jgi:zinc transporter ZupT
VAPADTLTTDMPLVAFLPFLTTLLGGIAALRIAHRLHPFMAVASGVLVATAVADLLPEAHALAGPDGGLRIGAAAIAGYLVFSLIEAFVHQSSFEHATSDRAFGGDAVPPPAPVGRLLALLPPASLIVHSTLDGLAIGFSFQAGGNVGLIVLLAVLAHDFADGLNVVTLALDAARGARVAILMLALDALAPVLGAGLSLVLAIPAGVLALLLAWFAGVFIAIGAGHLLPEAQHHRPGDGPGLVGLATLGAGIVLVVRMLAG